MQPCQHQHPFCPAGPRVLPHTQVFQVRQRGSGVVYAMKVMRKERILQKDHGDYVKAERDLLTAVLHPYIVTLRYSFQTASKLYLVLDFLNGGHLFFNLYRQVGTDIWGWQGGVCGKGRLVGGGLRGGCMLVGGRPHVNLPGNVQGSGAHCKPLQTPACELCVG